jgi:predicted enzyme related to lactoylglutathione lyase
MSKSDLRPHAYVLAVHDLARTTAYFVDVLGFSIEWADGDNWQTVIRGSVRLMLGRCPETIPAAKLGDHSYFGFFATDDVDALHAEFDGRGARILSGPDDKPWGWREMCIATPEGHRMMFAQPI